MLQKMRRNSGLTLAGVVVICLVLLLVAALAVPGLFSSTGCSNERNAAVSLKTLCAAEVDFRVNDRDRNKVTDFWTADVKGLYTMTPAAELMPGDRPKDLPIGLIERSVAGADADETFYPAGGENLPLSQFSPPSTKAGYWYLALVTDKSVPDPAQRSYKADTGGIPPMGPVHHKTRFGFVAFPFGSESGKSILRVNESNTVYRQEPKVIPWVGFSNPPGLKNVPPQYLEWPTDEELRKYWRKVD